MGHRNNEVSGTHVVRLNSGNFPTCSRVGLMSLTPQGEMRLVSSLLKLPNNNYEGGWCNALLLVCSQPRALDRQTPWE